MNPFKKIAYAVREERRKREERRRKQMKILLVSYAALIIIIFGYISVCSLELRNNSETNGTMITETAQTPEPTATPEPTPTPRPLGSNFTYGYSRSTTKYRSYTLYDFENGIEVSCSSKHGTKYHVIDISGKSKDDIVVPEGWSEFTGCPNDALKILKSQKFYDEYPQCK